MTGYIVRRLSLMIPTLIGVSMLVFLITRLTPGDPVRQIVGPDAPQDRVEEVRRDLGLDRPVVEQYMRFMGGAITGDLGESLRTRQPVMTELTQRFPTTFQLTTLAVSIAVVVGIPLGVVSATKRDTVLDKGATILALFGASMPLFWIAIMAILFFSVRLRWLPTGERTALSGRFPDSSPSSCLRPHLHLAPLRSSCDLPGRPCLRCSVGSM